MQEYPNYRGYADSDNFKITNSNLFLNNIMDDEQENIVVETDPTGRFERYQKCLGKGAYKEVFKAFDQEEGVEVAWNRLRIDHFTNTDISQIASEIEILEGLENENIINLQHSWVSTTPQGQKQVCFITELMTSGTLYAYIKRTKGPIKPKVIRNWARQVAQGLNYLHTRNPPIIHRDLKCQNIFINGNNGQAKIGDLGLATVKRRKHLTSVLGTPEFMAPELYDEKYDEKVDIYAFGMVLLEIATKECPYGECENQAQIFKKVSNGIKPAALNKVSDLETRNLIELCLQYNPDNRPTAAQLLNHHYFSHISLSNVSSDAGSSQAVIPPSTHLLKPEQVTQAIEQVGSVEMTTVDSSHHTFLIVQQSPAKNIDIPTSTCEVEAAVLNDHSDIVTLRMVYNNGSDAREIKFPFDLGEDTATDVVSELVEAELISAKDEQLVRRRIEEAVRFILIHQRSLEGSFYSEKSSATDRRLSDKEKLAGANSEPHTSYGSSKSTNSSPNFSRVPLPAAPPIVENTFAVESQEKDVVSTDSTLLDSQAQPFMNAKDVVYPNDIPFRGITKSPDVQSLTETKSEGHLSMNSSKIVLTVGGHASPERVVEFPETDFEKSRTTSLPKRLEISRISSDEKLNNNKTLITSADLPSHTVSPIITSSKLNFPPSLVNTQDKTHSSAIPKDIEERLRELQEVNLRNFDTLSRSEPAQSQRIFPSANSATQEQRNMNQTQNYLNSLNSQAKKLQ